MSHETRGCSLHIVFVGSNEHTLGHPASSPQFHSRCKNAYCSLVPVEIGFRSTYFGPGVDLFASVYSFHRLYFPSTGFLGCGHQHWRGAPMIVASRIPCATHYYVQPLQWPRLRLGLRWDPRHAVLGPLHPALSSGGLRLVISTLICWKCFRVPRCQLNLQLADPFFETPGPLLRCLKAMILLSHLGFECCRFIFPPLQHIPHCDSKTIESRIVYTGYNVREHDLGEATMDPRQLWVLWSG